MFLVYEPSHDRTNKMMPNDMGCHLTIYSLFIDIQNSFLDIKKCIFGYLNSFLDIQKSIYGYPRIHFWISKNQLIIGYPEFDFWISKNEF